MTGPRLAALFLALLLAGVSDLTGQALPAGDEAPSAGGVFGGRASWYGAAFQGRTTANGETYDKEGLTAAHRSLPFGTLLRVTSVTTGASVVVRINDRGPFVADRILDLSEAAARLIGLLPDGTGLVSCLVLAPEEAAAFGALPKGADPGGGQPVAGSGRNCRVQVASFRDPANAAATLERLRLSGILAIIEEAGPFRRVVLPSVPEDSLDALSARLKALGYRSLLVTFYP